MARRDLPLGHDPLRAVDPQLATVHPVTAPFEGIIFQIPHVAHNQGLRQPQHCPFGTQKSAAIRRPLGAPLRCRARRILDEEMHHLRPYRQWQDRTEPGGQEIIPGRPSLPGNRQDLGGVPGGRRRSHQAIETRRRRCARQHAVADDRGGKGQGQDRVAGRSRRSLMAATIWACRQSV